jgi:hypothetical protein
VLAAVGIADHVVHLLFAAGANAARALDARVEIDGHGEVRKVGRRIAARSEARFSDGECGDPMIELGMQCVPFFRHVGEQQLEHHLLRVNRPRTVGRDLHALRRQSAARSGEHALAFDLDHARAAVPVGPHAFLVAEVRDLDAVPLGGLDDRLARARDDALPVQDELDGHLIQFVLGGCCHCLPRCARSECVNE